MRLQPEKARLGAQTSRRAFCGTCHRSDYSGQQQVPRLAGQDKAYLLQALKQFRDHPGPGRDTIAVPWYRASAEQGNSLAQFNLGKRYLHGSGVEQDDSAVGDWFARSAGHGYPAALCKFGTLFRFGRGTGRDFLQAAQLHLAAASARDATAHATRPTTATGLPRWRWRETARQPSI